MNSRTYYGIKSERASSWVGLVVRITLLKSAFDSLAWAMTPLCMCGAGIGEFSLACMRRSS